MIAFYDLDISPVSYDFLHFLTGAQRAANGEPVHVVIVPGKNAGFKMFDHKPISRAEKQWRLGRVLLSSAALAGATVTVCPTREFAKQFETEGHFPPGYRVDFPIHHYSLSVAVDAAKAGFTPAFSPSERAEQHVARWLEKHGRGEGLVTITLRETHTPTRNSDFHSWMAAAYQLEKIGRKVVVIRDTERMTENLDDQWGGILTPCPLASIDLDFRLALYKRSTLNLSSSGGPFMLNVLLGLPYVFFLAVDSPPHVEDGRPHFAPTSSFMAKQGLPPGSQWPSAGKDQRIVWKPDTLDNILEALEPLKVAA